MTLSRRQFLKHGSVAVAAVSVPARIAKAEHQNVINRGNELAAGADDPATRALLDRAIEAARIAGASYADVRYVTLTREQWGFTGIKLDGTPSSQVSQGIGVRALYNGYWGYAALSGGASTPDAAAGLGREAVAQAKTSAKGKPRTVELAPTPVVSNGRWITPIRIDPFAISWDEKVDVVNGLCRSVSLRPFGSGQNVGMLFLRTTQAFASTEGSSFVQTLYLTRMNLGVGVVNARTNRQAWRSADNIVDLAGAGWEYVLDAPIDAHAERLLAEARDKTNAIPVDVGRYDIVFDGAALAKIADLNIRPATELDRAMTYLANGEGTSYLADPLNMVGRHQVGSSLLTVTADRSMPRGAATVQWDDEGVPPDEATLIKDGILTDFQTTRESAGWLASYYKQRGLPVRSHGGAICNDVSDAPTQGAHNISLAPSKIETSFESLCSGVKRGLAVLSGWGRADQQALNAEFQGDLVYEIKDGKLGRAIANAVVLTRAPDFWKNLAAIGGRATMCKMGFETVRSWTQPTPHTVVAPAALVTQVAVASDITRRW